jgi:23S rRNA (guanine745-N1)-methyltransferase
MYRCPSCGRALVAEPGRYSCSSGHDFDRSRDGYVNLLTARLSRRSLGDPPETLRARRQFLDAGYYLPLRQVLLEQVSNGSVLDVGCGEGYFTRPLGLGQRWVGGVDVSKAAIRLAARRAPSIAYAVANAFDLSVVTGSIDTVVNVLGPVAPGELARILAPRGLVVTATAGPDHLIELKSIVLEEPARHALRGPLDEQSLFRRVFFDRRNYQFELRQPDLDALADMTPYRRGAHRNRVRQLEFLTVTADFALAVYARGDPQPPHARSNEHG